MSITQFTTQEEALKAKNTDFFSYQNTNNSVFNIIDKLGYEALLEEMENFNKAFELMNKLGKERFSAFFSWYILKSDDDLDSKKYFLKYVLNEKEEEKKIRVSGLASEPSDDIKKFISIFSESQRKDFAKFIIENDLIDSHYSSLMYFLNYIDEEELLQKKNVKVFFYSHSANYKDYKKVTDFVFENSKELFEEMKKKNKEYQDKHGNGKSYDSAYFSGFIEFVILKEKKYFLEKLMNLKGEDFELFSQYLAIEAISKLYNKGIEYTKIEDDKEEECYLKAENKKEFTTKLISEIPIEKIKTNQKEEDSGYGTYLEDDEENNYFNLILEYYPEILENLKLEDITSKNIELPNFLFENEIFKNILKEKLLSSNSIDYGDLIENYGNIVRYSFREELNSIFVNKEVLKHIETNFSEKELIKYIVFLKKRTDAFYKAEDIIKNLILSRKTISKIPFLSKINDYKTLIKVKKDKFISQNHNIISEVLESDFVENIIDKEDNLTNILTDYSLMAFIELFIEEFDSFKKIKKSKALKLLEKLDYEKINKINTFILLTRRIENIKFKIKLEDIDEKFIDFVLNKFSKDFREINLYGDIQELEDFFDIEAKDISFFDEKNSIKNNFFDINSNLKKLIKLFGLDYKLSTAIEIENNLNNSLKDGEPRLFLKTILKREENFNFIISFFKKVYKKDIDINTLLIFTKNSGKNNSYSLRKIELLDKHIPDFDMKTLISEDGIVDKNLFNKIQKINFFHLGDFYDEKIISKFFKNWTLEKLEQFIDFFRNNQSLIEDKNSYRGNIERLIGDPSEYDYKEYRERSDILMYKINFYLIQRAIDSGDFSKLAKQLKTIQDFFRYNNLEKYDLGKIQENLDCILTKTNGILSKNLIKHFIVGEEYFGKLHINNFNDSIQKVENLTGIEIKNKDFEDNVNDVINLLLKINSIWLQNIFKKFPINEKKGRFWKLKDIKEDGILHKIIENPYFAYNISEKKGFSLKQIDKFLSYNLMLLSPDIEDKILEYDDIYYAYFKFFINSNAYNNNSDKLKKFPINLENFIDYMGDNEVIINFDKDGGIKSKGNIKPWTKAWFLEKPERKEYLKEENLKIIRKYGITIGLTQLGEDFSEYVKDYEKIKLNEELEFCRQNFGFNPKELISYKGEGEDKKFVFRGDVLTFYEELSDFRKNEYKNILEKLKKQEEIFKKFKLSILNKSDFFIKITEYNENIQELILELHSSFNKSDYLYAKDLFNIIYINNIFSRHNEELSLNFKNEISKLLAELKNADSKREVIKKYNIDFLNALKNNFKQILGIKKVPEKLTKDNIKTIVNHLTYIANINGLNNERQAIISLYLVLKLNNKFDNFKRGEDINLKELLEDKQIKYLKRFLEQRKQTDTIKNDFSKKDIGQLVKEEYSQFLGNIETIDSYLLSSQSNIEELLDPDMYNKEEKNILELSQKYEKQLGACLANIFGNLEKNIPLNPNFSEIKKELEKKFEIKDWTIQKVLEIQNILKQVNPIIKFVNFVEDLDINNKIKKLEQLKEPKEEIIQIFRKAGEEFTSNSNVFAVSSDIEYLEKIINNSGNIDIKEKELVTEYLKEIKVYIKELNHLKIEIQNRFKALKEKFGDKNEIFKDRFEELNKIIFSNSKEKNIISTFTTDFDKIIPNIRGCLGCMKKEINNNTNLNFGDLNRYFILSHLEGNNKSISDQIVYLFDTNKGYNFVLDLMYGDRAIDMYISHILVLIKKARQLDKKVGIFIPQNTNNNFELIKQKVLEKEENISIEKVNNMEIKNVNSSIGVVYQEFGMRNKNGILITL